ncbi:hypothetical protein [Candidatus Pollutiaquabacter sp.]|uniref:hypothetical protein n=1 Tax=Candidatus Pollutiaquabacter sp. TaxID=3416354 RepID=UPI003CA89714|nr:hypothetical protein [Bacteroidota bacterium]
MVRLLNRPVQAASVTLAGRPPIPSTAFSRRCASPRKATPPVVLEFEFKLEAFLNIEVIKNDDTARSFIRLKEHETVTKTVSL